MYRYFINPFKNIKIGKNNIISKSAIIHNDVIIGDNNKIYDNCIIYPKTTIGDNNIIFNNNIIGEYPVQSSENYRDYCFENLKGTMIGNNNFFHVRNILFSGTNRITYVGNNNSFLAECHMGHDVNVTNNCTFYPRVILGGFSTYLNNSNMGGYSFIQQRVIIGQYTMIGGSQIVTKNVFPYFVFINGKITRLNHIKLSDDVIKYENEIKEIAEYYYNKEKNNDILCEKIKNLPENMIKVINEFMYYKI